jgi:uncharacterized protein (TIGR00730 family)
MDKTKPAICVFCGSSYGDDPAYANAAQRFGALIAARGFSLVFGGGDVGLMGEVARAARAGGALVTGIIPHFLRAVEAPLETGEDLIVTDDLQQRKARMLALADAFAVLPGGLGTLDEFFEIITSAQLHVLAKPIVLLDLDGFFAPLERLLSHVAAKDFARKDIAELYSLAATPEAAIDLIAAKLGRTPGA